MESVIGYIENNAASETTIGAFVVAGIVAVIAFAVLVVAVRVCIRICPPNMLMVVQGARTRVGDKTYGFKIYHGGRAIVIPFLHRAELLDLGIIPINVRVEGVNAANGIRVGGDATACVCVDLNDEGLQYTAVERMLGKSWQEIQEQIQQTMVGNLRAAMSRTTPLEALGMVESAEELEGEATSEEGSDTSGASRKKASSDESGSQEGGRSRFRRELLNDSNEDLSSFGMRVVSVSFQRIWDSSGYIANLATKSVARKRREIEIEEAKLRAQAEGAESDAVRRQENAKNQAEEKIAEAEKASGVTERECKAQVERARQEAEAEIAKAKSEAQEKVAEAQVELQATKNVSEVTLKAEYEKEAADLVAQGDDQAIRTRREVRNKLLQEKVDLLKQAEGTARLPLFVQQQLGQLFQAYEEHARNQKLDHLVSMDGNDGVNDTVNRGPEALVAFLRHFEEAFGIRVRDMVEPSSANRENSSMEAKA